MSSPNKLTLNTNPLQYKRARSKGVNKIKKISKVSKIALIKPRTKNTENMGYTPFKMKGASLYKSPAKTTGTQEFPEGELSPEQRGKAIKRHNSAYPKGHTDHSGQPQDTKTSPANK